jgi:2-haloacid dehalogenase
MQHYESFAVCTSQALQYTCAQFGFQLDEVTRGELLGAYRTLPAFDDAREGLTRCQKAGFRLFAFSNGRADTVEALLAQAGIREFFLDVVSVDEVKSFKPNPGVYAHFLRRAGATGSEAWLISGNPFDVIGARSAGLCAAWIRRSPEALFDPWGIEPNLTVNSLSDLAARINA